MPKVLLFSDLHAHTYREFAGPPVDAVNLNSRLENCLHVLDAVLNYAIKNDIEKVIFAGDLFHKRNVIQTAMYNLVWNRVALFAKSEVDLYLLVGNHDQTTLDGRIHSLEPMQEIAHVIYKPTIVEITRGAYWQFVPYMEKVSDLKKAMQGPANFLVAHAGLAGAVTGPVEYQPDEAMKPSDVPEYEFAFFGHYHKRQKMRDKCWYIGSPIQQHRGEREEEAKGFLVFDTDKLTFKVVPITAPKFVTIEEGDGEGRNKATGNFVDLIGTAGPWFNEFVEELREVAAGVNPIYKPRVSEARRVRIKLNPGMELDTMASKYIKEYAPDGLDADHLLWLTKKFLDT